MHSNLTFRRRFRARRGQTLVEYALILALIVVVSAAILIQMGGTLRALYSTIDSQVARTATGS
jgi:Flp pilus assembly pilin Flp